ncbi:hypothetical protein, partial [Salmonella enterica]
FYSDSSDPLTLLPSYPLTLLPSYPLTLLPSYPLTLLPSYPLYAAIRRVALAPSDNVLMNDGLP